MASPARSSDPLGMRMTVSAVRKQFPKVRNVDTSILEQWINERVRSSPAETDDGVENETKEDAVVRRLVILDVRPEPEVAVSRISSAIRVDPDETDMTKLEQIINSNATKTDKHHPVQVVMYCSVGYRSSALATKLQSAIGRQENAVAMDIYNLEGSIFKWANEDRPIVNEAGKSTVYVHPYNRVWGLLLNSDRRKYTPET